MISSRARAAVFAAPSAVLVLAASCDPSTSAVGPGGECSLATDCAPGLVCVEQANKTRVCSDDLSRVAGRPAETGGAEEDAEAEGGGSNVDGSTPPPPPRSDSGAPDAGQLEEDSGTPPPPDDAGDDAG